MQLVLDDSAATLGAMAAGTHFSDIVNVTIYKPDGSPFDNFTVVKNWSFAAPVPTTKVLSISTTATGPWSTSLTTNLSPLYARVQVLDQYGNPWVGVDPTLSLLESGSTVSVVYLNTIAASSQGFVIGPFTLPAGGLWTLTAWNDTLDPIGSIQVGEIQSNQATVTYTGGTQAPF